MYAHGAHNRTKHFSRVRVRRRPLPTDVRHNPFVSRVVWRPRWVVLLAAPVLIIGALAVSAALGGCGYEEGGTDTTGPGSGAGSIVYPTAADELVFRVEYGGGLVPIESIFTSTPMLAVYGDGRVISQGAIPAVYPGPALPNLLAAQLSPDGMQRLLAAARDAGLLETGIDYGQPAVADGSTTTYIVAADGKVFETSIYHLGAENSSDRALTDRQIEQRLRVVELQEKLVDLAAWLGDDLGAGAPYEWQALSILILPADLDREIPGGIEPRVVDWPLTDLKTLGDDHLQGRREVITGSDLEVIRPLVLEADTLTLWKSGGKVYSLLLRPLFPEEIG